MAVLLTSHDMADVASLCPRLVLIDKGQVQYDGKLDELAAKLLPYKQVPREQDGAGEACGAETPAPAAT